MKKFKRIIALVTVAMFVLSFAAPAIAKTTTEAVDRLNALGIVVGYGDGSFKPEQNITRAEYAAIVVQALGLGKAAEYVKGNTKFKDVKADHWASGIINIAVDQNILAGYPDGTFKPEKNVTYNEAITMVVRMLGYYQAIKNPVYPTSFIAKASELNLLDNMVISDYNAPATRGNVFMLADDALDTRMWGLLETNDKGEQTYGKLKTLLEEKLKVVEYKDRQLVGVSVAASAIENNEAVLANLYDNARTTYDVKGQQGRLFQYFGQKVKAYINDKDELIAVKSDESSIFTDKVKKIEGSTVYFYNNDKKDLATGAILFPNYSATTVDAASNLKVGDYATFILDGNNKIYKVVRSQFDNLGIVDTIAEKKIEFNDDTEDVPNKVDVSNVDAKYVQVFRNGAVATLSDVKQGDVVAYYKDSSDHTLVLATDATVKGKLNSASATAVGSDYFYKLVVGDKTVYSPVGKLQYSTDGGKTFDYVASIDDVNDDLVGQEVTVKLDPNGEAIYVIAGEAAGSGNKLDVLVRNITTKTDAAANTATDVGYIRVTKQDGTMAVYEIDNDDYTINGNATTATIDLDDSNGTSAVDVKPKDFVTITLNSAGKVSKIEKANTDDLYVFDTAKLPADRVDEDNKVLYGDNGTTKGALLVTENTTFLNVDTYGDTVNESYIDKTTKSSWASAKGDLNDDTAITTKHSGNTTVQGVTRMWADGKKLRFVFIDDDLTISSDLKYGVTFGGKYGIGGGDYAVKMWTPADGEAKQYTLDSSVGTIYGDSVYTFKLTADNKIKDATKLSANVTGVTVAKVETIDDNVVITAYVDADNDGVQDTNESSVQYLAKKATVKYFDISSGTMKTITSIGKGDVIDLYDFLNKDGDVKTPTDDMYDFIIKKDSN